MACQFAFVFKLSERNKQARFHTGEEEYRASVVSSHSSEIEILLEWNQPSSHLILAKLYSEFKSFPACRGVITQSSTATLIVFSNYRLVGINPSFTCLIEVVSLSAYESISIWEQNHGFKKSATSTESEKMADVPKQPVVVKRFEQLSADFRNAFINGDLSDVILKLDSTVIPAHKVVLSSRSPVFAKMFQNKMKENVENCVTICDTSPEVMNEFLSFVYTGITSVCDSKMAADLYVVADKYDVKDLKQVCSDVLRNIVNLDNAIDIFVMSTLYDDTNLKKSALDFISLNYFRVRNHPSWKKFLKDNQELAVEVLTSIVENKVSM